MPSTNIRKAMAEAERRRQLTDEYQPAVFTTPLDESLALYRQIRAGDSTIDQVIHPTLDWFWNNTGPIGDHFRRIAEEKMLAGLRGSTRSGRIAQLQLQNIDNTRGTQLEGMYAQPGVAISPAVKLAAIAQAAEIARQRQNRR